MQRGQCLPEVHMLWIDIGDDADLGGELQEGAVGFVGLDHHPLAFANARVGSPVIDDAAGNHRWVEPAAFQQAGDQRGGRRLAVGAGDGDGGARPHQLGQHLGAADDGDAALLGGFEFRIACFHCGRDDESGGAVDIGRVMVFPLPARLGRKCHGGNRELVPDVRFCRLLDGKNLRNP